MQLQERRGGLGRATLDLGATSTWLANVASVVSSALRVRGSGNAEGNRICSERALMQSTSAACLDAKCA